MLVLLAAALAQPPMVEPLPPPTKPAAKPAGDKPADPPAPAKPPAKPTGPPEFEVQFTDGGNIRVVILEPTVSVTTKFGKLDVPFAELRKVDFGFRYPAGVEEKVAAAVAKLGAAAFRDREEAERELLAQKEYALAAVRRAAKSGDPEVVRRAEPLLRKLLAAVPEDRHTARDHDIVETHDFTVKGRLELTGLKVRTRQFGEATLRVDEVRAFRTLNPAGQAVEVEVSAAQYGRQGWPAWLETAVEVAADDPLHVTAGGSIDLAPNQQPGQVTSGPGGFPQAMVQGPPVQQVVNGFNRGMAVNRQFLSGTLVGKIGANGPVFVVGNEYKQAKPGAAGKLYLAIAPSNWGGDSSGSYKVKVKVGE